MTKADAYTFLAFYSAGNHPLFFVLKHVPYYIDLLSVVCVGSDLEKNRSW